MTLDTRFIPPSGSESVITPAGSLGTYPTFDKGYYDNVRVLIKVMQNLAQTIKLLQSVAATMADYLNFLSKWQKMYSEVIKQVPTLTVGSPGVIGKQDDVSATNPVYSSARQSLNAFTGSLIQTSTGYRDQISTVSKTMQTNLNQTTDQINQTSNMFTSILQEMNTILSSIFR